jgi:hypothetical protein
MNYGIDPKQLRELVIVPVLRQLRLYSIEATSLVLGTAMHESHLTYLKQVGTGPALGLWQMEPATHDDIWANFLKYRTDLAGVLTYVAGDKTPTADHMVGNLWYACAMARMQYRRVPGPLPENNPGDLAAFWKQHYNTPLGAGTVEQALPHFHNACKLTRE